MQWRSCPKRSDVRASSSTRPVVRSFFFFTEYFIYVVDLMPFVFGRSVFTLFLNIRTLFVCFFVLFDSCISMFLLVVVRHARVDFQIEVPLSS